MTNFQYLQCPYCTKYQTCGGKRIPKTVGKYRVKYYNNFLVFKCSRCAREFKLEYNPKIYLWTKMTAKQRDEFKLKHYKGGKKNK